METGAGQHGPCVIEKSQLRRAGLLLSSHPTGTVRGPGVPSAPGSQAPLAWHRETCWREQVSQSQALHYNEMKDNGKELGNLWREGSYLGSAAQMFPMKALGVTAAAGGRPRWAQRSMPPTAVAGVRTRVPGVWVYLEKVPHSHHFPRGKLSSGAGPEEQRRGAARPHGSHRRNII